MESKALRDAPKVVSPRENPYITQDSRANNLYSLLQTRPLESPVRGLLESKNESMKQFSLGVQVKQR